MTLPQKHTYIVIFRDLNGFYIYSADIVAANLEEALHHARHRLDIKPDRIVSVFQDGVRVKHNPDRPRRSPTR